MYHPVIDELIDFIYSHEHNIKLFTATLEKIKEYDLEEFSDIQTLNDWFDWCNNLLITPPYEIEEGTNLVKNLLTFNFYFYQEMLGEFEEFLNDWRIKYAMILKDFYDSEWSINPQTLETLYKSSTYRMDEYIQNPSGWKTFNQFFARYSKPGYHLISSIHDESVIVSPADSIFLGVWQIDEKAIITAKGITWSVKELLHENPYAKYFKNGIFIHSFLSPADYHRFHTPLEGKVLYQEIIPGDIYIESYPQNNVIKSSRAKRHLEAVDGVGYQFNQTRGVLILETPMGIVALIPVGMGFVSSVVLTADEGVYLRKGEEFGYFQYGASDIIVLFPGNTKIIAKVGTHYKQGQSIGIMKPLSKSEFF